MSLRTVGGGYGGHHVDDALGERWPYVIHQDARETILQWYAIGPCIAEPECEGESCWTCDGMGQIYLAIEIERIERAA